MLAAEAIDPRKMHGNADAEVYRRYWPVLWVKPNGGDYRKARMPQATLNILKTLLDLARDASVRDVHISLKDLARASGENKGVVFRSLQYLEAKGFVTKLDKALLRTITLYRPFESVLLEQFSASSQAILRVLYDRADNKRNVVISTSELSKITGLAKLTINKELHYLNHGDTLSNKQKLNAAFVRLEVARRPGPQLMLERLPQVGERSALAPFYDDDADEKKA